MMTKLGPLLNYYAPNLCDQIKLNTMQRFVKKWDKMTTRVSHRFVKKRVVKLKAVEARKRTKLNTNSALSRT